MSIDFLLDLERDLERGKDVFGCPAIAKNQWELARTPEELQKTANRVAQQKRLPVNICRLIHISQIIGENMFLVPIKIGDPGPRGEQNVQWATVETQEAAEMMRDVRHGTPPIFRLDVEETIAAPESE